MGKIRIVFMSDYGCVNEQQFREKFLPNLEKMCEEEGIPSWEYEVPIVENITIVLFLNANFILINDKLEVKDIFGL